MKGKKLKPYMAYSAYCGRGEGAILIFAYTAREAKRIGWSSFIPDICDNDYKDFRVSWLKNSPWLLEQKRKEVPHIIDSPISCDDCGLWGYEMIGSLCIGCYEDAEEDL